MLIWLIIAIILMPVSSLVVTKLYKKFGDGMVDNDEKMGITIWCFLSSLLWPITLPLSLVLGLAALGIFMCGYIVEKS